MGMALRRGLRRIAADPHVLLAVAVVVAALVIEAVSQDRPGVVLAPSIAFLGIQILTGLRWQSGRRGNADTVRLLIALAAVLWMSVGTGDPVTLPLASLILPIIAMAAAIGARQVLVVGAMTVSAAIVMYSVPAFATPDIRNGLIQRGIALAATAVVLAVGTRRTVAMLERAIQHAHDASDRLRRRSSQMAAVEEVGRLLSAE